MKTEDCVHRNSEKTLWAMSSIIDVLVIGLTLAKIFGSIVSEESVTYVCCLFESMKNVC